MKNQNSKIQIEDRPRTKYWIKKFIDEPRHAQKKFKRLDKGYPPFDIDEELIEIVEFEEFVKIEENRIPLFIGTQCGINPRINNMQEFFNGRKLVAILGKSLLSRHVSGLSLYQIEVNETSFSYNKIESYNN